MELKHTIEPKPMEFMDLGTDCYREICDRLDNELLCALAGTCRQLQTIAQASFAAKKISSISFSRNDLGFGDAHLQVKSAAHLFAALRHFGQFFNTSTLFCGPGNVRSASLGQDQRIQENVFDYFARHCCDKLKTMFLQNFDRCGTAMDKNPLLAKIEILSMSCCSFLRFPFGDLQNLTKITVSVCARTTMSKCLDATYPQLRQLNVMGYDIESIDQHKFDRFIERHSELTHLTVFSMLKLSPSITRLKNIKEFRWIEMNGRELNAVPLLRMLKHSKLIRLSIMFPTNFDAVVDRLRHSPNQNSLEKLRWLGVYGVRSDNWTYLAQMNKLRVFRISFSVGFAIDQTELVKGITTFVEQSSTIERINIVCGANITFYRSNYRNVDRICRQKGISLTVGCQYDLDLVTDDEKMAVVEREFDELKFKTTANVILAEAYFGRQANDEEENSDSE